MRCAHGEVGSMLIAQHFAPLLAAASPDAETTGKGVLIFIAVACPLITLVIGALGLWVNSRRNPPIAEEMYKNFIPRQESDQTVQRLDERVSEAFNEITNLRNHTDAEINSIRANMTKAYGDFERALGRIEGKLDTERK